MSKMKMGRVLTFVTMEDEFGNSDYVITPIPAHRTVEMEFARLGLVGKIESYELSGVMPLSIAWKQVRQKAKGMGITEIRYIEW